jgi:hypothetical protein
MPTTQQISHFLAHAPDSAWANFDITAGDAEGFWKAVEELPEETLEDIRGIMTQRDASAPQGPDVQHEPAADGQGHDKSKKSLEVEDEEVDTESRQDSFLDDDYLDWLDSEIEKRG